MQCSQTRRFLNKSPDLQMIEEDWIHVNKIFLPVKVKLAKRMDCFFFFVVLHI